MSESPHLGLGYLAPSQAQKHVSVNEAFRRLDAIVQLGVLDRTLTAPPPSPTEGDRHIVAAGATGTWAGRSGRIAAFLDGTWTFIEPKAGWLAYVAAENILVAHLGGAWTGSITSLETLTKLGVNATADLVNRFAVSAQAALFNHAGAGVQVKLNKAAASDVASLLFQRGFSGRAEFGLVGSDALSLKVSADGSSWTSALAVDAATGAVDLPATPMVRLDKFTASGTWTKPSWARLVRVHLVGGGHGGGSGGLRAAGVAAAGGGGGAPATMTEGSFLAASLPATVAVTVGTGGAGGAAQTAGDADGVAGSAGGASSFGGLISALADPVAFGGGGAAASGAAGSVQGSRFYPPLASAAIGGSGSVGAGAGGSNGGGRFCPGGGGGGGLSAANAASGGGASGFGAVSTGVLAFTIGGAAPGGAGQNGPAPQQVFEYPIGGGSGSGGGANASGPGGAGGAGAVPGGSGGGGGASRNGFASGKGGDGARGEVWVLSYR